MIERREALIIARSVVIVARSVLISLDRL